MSEVTTPGTFRDEAVVEILPHGEDIPDNLRAATARLLFPPSYVIVGVYRLFTDKSLLVPAWKKCKHGTVRGAGVALVWVGTAPLSRSPGALTLADAGRHQLQAPEKIRGNIPHQVCPLHCHLPLLLRTVRAFPSRSPSVTGLSRDAVFGIRMPFDLPTCSSPCVSRSPAPLRTCHRCHPRVRFFPGFRDPCLLPLEEHPYRARPCIRADNRVARQGPRVLEALRRGMG